jgi:hypothetical protein
MPVAAFVVRTCVLLVRFRVDQRRVEVDNQIIASRTSNSGPGPIPSSSACCGDAAQFDRTDLVEGAPHRCLGRDRTEHRLLRTDRSQIGQTRCTVSERQDHLRQRATRVVTTLRNRRHCCAQLGGQTRQIGGLREPRDPGVRDQTFTVAGHLARSNQTATLNHENGLFSFEWGEGSEGMGGRRGRRPARFLFRAITPGQNRVLPPARSRSTSVALLAEASSPLR